MSSSSKNPETIVLHAGHRRDATTNSVAVPIYQTTSYQFDDTAHAADLFALKRFGNIYTRIMNPTTDVLEQRLAALEGGAAALAVSSGQAASAISIQNIAKAGDNVVSSTDLYGGTWNLFANTLKDQGIEVRFVDPQDPQAFARATDDKTRAYYAETLPNPKLRVFPIREVADIGRKLGVPLIVDNTAAPILARPFDHGAAIVVYSTTKYIGGHSDIMFGCVSANAKALPALKTVMQQMGLCVGPDDMYLALRGLRTMAVRLARHNESGLRVARWLENRPEVLRVLHPALESNPGYKIWQRDFSGACGLFSLVLKPTSDKSVHAFMNELSLFGMGFSWGGFESLVILFDCGEYRTATKWAPGGPTLRIHIGLEDPDDLIADLERGFAALALANK